MAAKGKMHERTLARESALALLYSSDITESDVAKIVDEGAYPADDLDLPVYAEALVRGVAAHRDEIDGYLSTTSENWALGRMPVVDRGILRLATYEMVFVEDVPVSVTINEAVELAKRYGGEDDSSRFVNGILGRIARRLEKGAEAVADAGRTDGDVEASGSSAESADDPAGDSACSDASPLDGTPETAIAE
ncbi:hypothetical protein JI75_08455 [Berryella intestinalis]|uniref:Transcription antitermination protein NusB n=1 Tax=Berryella intestinalis TaxID=1531429 RepID=A0A0A8B5A2_9ACTN|nr:transcription antitermination factor NusB [Berryella intestinalis]AJC12671.1 hypothetical protein JI75_08455 [Berryella intestinalis]